MRVILVEDQALLREGLAGLFRDAGHDVVASLGDCDGVEDAVREYAPDVVVLDVRLPPHSPTRAPVPLPRSNRRGPTWVSSCSRNTSRRRTAWSLPVSVDLVIC
jgi:DNA-binding NarL/FixJ family response regulator